MNLFESLSLETLSSACLLGKFTPPASQTQQQVLAWQSLHAVSFRIFTVATCNFMERNNEENKNSASLYQPEVKVQVYQAKVRKRSLYIHYVKPNMTELSRAGRPQKDNNHTLSALDDHPFLKTSLFLSSHLCNPPPSQAFGSLRVISCHHRRRTPVSGLHGGGEGGFITQPQPPRAGAP